MDALWVCTLFLFVNVALGDACVSGQFSQSGECCSPCPPGHGVEVECGMEDTKCQPCPEGTFSPSDGLSPCLPCARCPAGIPELTSCSATQDTHCDCDQHFYLWRDGKSVAGLCAACTMCGRGEGVVRLCGAQGNTQCQPCRPGTFSEEKSDIKPCQACSQCSDTEVEIRACQLNSDTLCMDKKLHILSRPPESDGPLAAPRLPGLGLVNDGEEASPAPGGGAAPRAPGFTPQDDGSSNHILVYVSVLAAVVLGLLLYVAYKCVSSHVSSAGRRISRSRRWVKPALQSWGRVLKEKNSTVTAACSWTHTACRMANQVKVVRGTVSRTAVCTSTCPPTDRRRWSVCSRRGAGAAEAPGGPWGPRWATSPSRWTCLGTARPLYTPSFPTGLSRRAPLWGFCARR
ncbi:tumor necrosis factor receptor superfamily member 16-like isoform X2 [Oncorhynchus clarkii lewisi]|uniref:tumor necrosis factor receptor superfamily member 16-like isoform X2 n=1 Tax=Oncorhynchus clarkii lewisi TaxID=490388 RepID=UPI0039B93109